MTSSEISSITPVVLCGGAGTRLWPLSREYYPKQLLALHTSDQSLLQATIKRGRSLQESELRLAPAVIVSNEAHRFLVAEQLRQAGLGRFDLLLEPMGKNTAPALTVAAQHIFQNNGDSVMLVMPADHVILDQAAFAAAVNNGMALANQGYLVTFGIVPTHAETGYGYIKQGKVLAGGGAQISAFVEKPDSQTASQYLQSGDYLWNSGMFLFKASVWLDAIKRFRSDIHDASIAAYDAGKRDTDFYRLDQSQFDACPSESIDYAVMEKVIETDAPEGGLKGAVIPMDAGWSDVGSWQSIWDVGEKDQQGNVTQGEVLLHESKDSVFVAQNRIVAGVGVNDLVVVETADAVLVAAKNASQEVKTIVNRLKLAGRDEALIHRKVYRPWGAYEGVDAGDRYQVKHIIVNPGAALSLQMHHHRAEHWIVVRGTAKVTCGEKTFLLSENQSTYIPIGEQHRLENPGSIPLEIVEVQSGSYLGEDDIVRFDDQYGREGEKG